MARKGGQTTFSGTKFQAEITLLYLGRLLDLRLRNEEDKVCEVNIGWKSLTCIMIAR